MIYQIATMLLATRISMPTRLAGHTLVRRAMSTLPNNSHIKVFADASRPNTHILTYLETNPPSPGLAIGTTTEVPPTPRSFSENPRFLSILNEVLKQHAHRDEGLQAQAKAFASPGGATLGSGGVFFPQQRQKRRGDNASAAGLGGGGGAGGSSAGGASAQGGAGGGGVGGWVHLSDARNPPDYGRIAWPEDILGSVEVDAEGNPMNNFQPSGTYRILTNEGILGLSPFLRQKVIEKLREEEQKERLA
ncbi:hypothetical protein MGG_07221 [Pyricularia oryzae 70-15]|uniref:Uncharacterized protein n=1 Tax=Pyricularia oryzae (strain 70-15 / ATCC MYA-4617 / FGSC 8958) TaxID=242507 RepID=G4MU31_PYRO7|nr:uncharacterized protein MGG_07221 [Pyricularia oryzae 70-15]EHA55631.1 hypothetical protein MGG_07221 [Pyricularia oryzae 70-15]KAI7926958.1 hypothetical protein M9X92_002446 [Pyricularia oryzae]KAI7932191.1 hypothetical protein M0657_000630 [Pyricularia oryzae]